MKLINEMVLVNSMVVTAVMSGATPSRSQIFMYNVIAFATLLFLGFLVG